MFVLSSQGNAMYQAVAMLVTLALAIWMLNLQTFAQAANLTDISDTLSDSDVSVVSDHTIGFTIPVGSAGVTSGQALSVTFPAGFDLTNIVVGDVDLEVGGVDEDLVAAGATASQWNVTDVGQVLTFTSGGASATLAAGDVVTIKVGTNATGPGVNQIINPTAGSYELTVNTPVDSGQTRVVIIDDVLVTANVNTSFDFIVSGFNTAGINVNDAVTTGTSSATTLPYYTLTAGAPEILGQLLQVETNAINGFVVTVAQSSEFESETGAVIDSFIDGSYEDTPTGWVSPDNDITLANTWGHWGLTSSDDLNTNEFGSDLWVAASTTPREVFAHDGPSDGETANMGSTTVAYQVEITALQEAADDYSTVLTYVATPTF